LTATILSIQDDTATIRTKQGAFNGTITNIKDGVATIQTDLGTLMVSVDTTKSSAYNSSNCGMLQALPRNHGPWTFAYPQMPIDHHAGHFCQQRKRIAQKLQNPRIQQIHFHTFRYWRGTMLYHQLHSEYYVMQQLGHRKIENTLLYINLEQALFQGTVNYISRVAKTEKEVCKLIEDGFDFVCDFQDHKVFRKRK